MRNDGETKIDILRVKDALSVLKPNNQLFEVRILKGKAIISGYFTDVDVLEKAFKTVDLRGANIFYTLNEIDPDCYARNQKDKFLQEKTTTSDSDIVSFQWLLVDLDPVRKTGISSTNTELIKAYDKAQRVVEYLRDKGFPAPVMACSGNGMHLLYRVALANNNDNVKLLEKCLKALDLLFSDEYVEIDKKVFNPARISKLYGTIAQKGSSTTDRPHRMSRIISRPDTTMVTEKALLQALANEYPEEAEPTKHKAESFDIDGWLEQYGIRVDKVRHWKDTTTYVLQECPFDGSHKSPDSAIIKMPNGAICFKCLHNSCSGHDWHELRLKYEPDAYDDKRAEDEARIEAGWKAYKAFNRQRTDVAYQQADPEGDPAQMFDTVMDIMSRPEEERVCIPTGLVPFDKRVGGLAKGEISLISGLRGAAKSTLLSQVALYAVDKGFNTIVYSGELKDKRFVQWLLQQAAGFDHVSQSKKYAGMYYCNMDVRDQIGKWIGQHLRLYNNKYGSNFRSIATTLQSVIKAYQADFVIIDNMSILDLTDISSDKRTDKWDQQKLFVETLKNLAMICNCHIAFVAHPRKALGFLRLDDVGGSGSLGNLVDNAFIVHRVNNDFLRGYSGYMGRDWKSDCTNVIEVVKERETGIQDMFIPLWYEPETRRMKNSKDERIVLSWDYDGFIGEQIDVNDLPWA